MQSDLLQKERAFFNWSGGKDSALALYKMLQSGKFNIQCLLTNVNAVQGRILMHGVRRSLLEAQAVAINIPLQTIELPEQPTMQEFEQNMMQAIQQLKQSGCSKAIFGDIFLEDLKNYREQKFKEAGIECVFPLWKIDTTELIHGFIALGFKAIIVCVNEEYIDKKFCGRLIDENFINHLPANVDICGENGEFHSFVFDGPLFKQPVKFSKGEIVYKLYKAPKPVNDTQNDVPAQYGFYFCDLLPV